MKLLNPDIPDPKDPLKALDLFIESVAAVNEEDYGDCMRQWNHDLLYLEDHLKSSNPWALKKINEMKEFVQFNPNWDVPSTKKHLLQEAHEIHEHLIQQQNFGRNA